LSNQDLKDAKIALVVLVVVFLLGLMCGRALAEDTTYISPAPDDASVRITVKTFKKLRSLIDYVCSDGYLSDRTSIDRFKKEICQ